MNTTHEKSSGDQEQAAVDAERIHNAYTAQIKALQLLAKLAVDALRETDKSSTKPMVP
jgi:hypothetical protein